MLLNYLKLSLRLLVRNPFFTFINVLGLSVGFAAFFALWGHASSELQSDQYHLNFERIARLGIDWRWTDDGKNWGFLKVSWLDTKSAKQIAIDFPEVESYVRTWSQPDFENEQVVLSVEKNGASRSFKETRTVYADANLFEFFSIPLLHGNKRSVLSEANSIVLSRKTASKYFGTGNPVGEVLMFNGQTLLKVTGVFADLPDNTHLNFDIVLSNTSLLADWDTDIWPGCQSYVQLREGVELKEFERKIASKKDVYWYELLKARPNVRAEMWAQPLKDIAFSNNFTGDYFTPKSRLTLIMFEAVAVLILLMAWMNYINLTLARTSRRMMEVATRKMSGAVPLDFVKQFLTESFLINLIALALAGTLNQVGKVPAEVFLHLSWGNLSALSLPSLVFLSILIVTGIIVTGLYPAFLAVKYNSRKLISIRSSNNKSQRLPGVLTTFQYTAASVLMLWVMVEYLQLNFIFDKSLRLNNEIVIIESPTIRSDNFSGQMEYFKNQLLLKSLVKDATLSTSVSGDDEFGWFNIRKSEDDPLLSLASSGGVSHNFIDFFGVKLLAGRNFVPTDRGDVALLSTIGIQRLGYDNASDALGKRIQVSTKELPLPEDWRTVEIIGVIDDFRHRLYFNLTESSSESSGNGICLLHKDYVFVDKPPDRLSIKLSGSDWHEVIPTIENLFKDLFPGNPFVFQFLNDHINRHYRNEEISRNQILFFTILAIGISCLGLLGMISNRLTEKTKEIGVRKVLGAKLRHIAQILLSSTVKQVMIANALGIPLAYYLTRQYLEKFSERIIIPWWYFALPLALLFCIMFITIASILVKAAKTNPVEALKYE